MSDRQHIPARPAWLLAAALALFAGCLALGLLAATGFVVPLDTVVAAAAAPIRQSGVGVVLRAWELLGELGPFLALLWVTAALLVLTRRRTAALALGLGALATVLSSVIKFALAVPRPAGGEVLNAVGESFAYPSGHTTRAAVSLGLLGLVAIREMPPPARPSAAVVGAVVFGGVVVMAVARVVSGEHWLSDVAGGALLGGAWLAGTAWAWR